MHPLNLGTPPLHDVEAAAKLLLEYRRAGMSPETASMFAMSVYDFDAVARRADELTASDLNRKTA